MHESTKLKIDFGINIFRFVQKNCCKVSKYLHFSGLNGIRAIAAMAVVFAHTTQQLNDFGLNSYIFGKLPDGYPTTTLLGGFSVSIFFSLSGFLITYLLLEEKKMNGINIKNFYFRRVLRIWPIYYLYIFLSGITLIIFSLPFEKNILFFYIFLVANIPFVFRFSIPLLEHFWSIGVEEQFYSFWPWVIKKNKSIFTITIIIIIILISLKCFFRLYDIKMNHGQNNWPYLIIQVTRFQCMLIGAVAAILFFEKNIIFLKLVNNYYLQFVSWIVFFTVAINKFHLISLLDNELISLVTVFIIIGQIQIKYRIINLNGSVLDFIGKISYGIYVLHPLILFYLSKIIVLSGDQNIFNYLVVYILTFSTTIFIAYLSYHYFESKFLKLKERYSIIVNH